ncbi:MAG: hypothetical protein IT317_08480 [Anaerolineales bacterium]|nr:hypothetical protein [Anaerolineales bacterium]
MDTQWPRFEVFTQARADQPARSVGAVHAPDLELALLNARDVFGRRPECASVWVAPESAVYRRTSEKPASAEPNDLPVGPLQRYLIFRKRSQRQSESFVVQVGGLEARSGAEAVRLAAAQSGGETAWVWWAVPEAVILRTTPEEAESLFASALGKPYRQPSFYHVLTQMRAVRTEPDVTDGEAEP